MAAGLPDQPSSGVVQALVDCGFAGPFDNWRSAFPAWFRLADECAPRHKKHVRVTGQRSLRRKHAGPAQNAKQVRARPPVHVRYNIIMKSRLLLFLRRSFLLLAIAQPPLSAAPSWSNGLTMRLRLNHMGTKKEDITVKTLRLEGPWAGPRDRLLDTSNLGDSCLRLKIRQQMKSSILAASTPSSIPAIAGLRSSIV